MERIYDPTKPFDIGGRFDLLYGSDARFTKNTFPGGHDYAILENVGEGKGANWLDFTQAYGQLWFKTAQDSGLEVLGGKFYSPVGYEATDAAFSPMYSHSYLANFAVPTAHTGVKLNYVWNPQISTYFAVVTGWDTFDDNNDAPSYIVGGAWNSCTKCGQKSKDALTVNFITGPEKTDNSHDDRSLIDATYIHLWTEQLLLDDQRRLGHRAGLGRRRRRGQLVRRGALPDLRLQRLRLGDLADRVVLRRQRHPHRP